MSERRSLLPHVIVGAAGLVTLLLTVHMLARLERVEEVVHTAPTGEARRNPLLAAERLLRRMNVPVSSSGSLNELPPPDRVIVLAAEDRVLTRTRAERLLDWVERGGHLIVGPHLKRGRVTAETLRDPLFEALGIAIDEYGDDPGPPPREVVSVESDADGEPLQVEFFSDFAIALSEESPEERSGYAMISRERGLGLVTVLNDLRFVRSEEIGKLSHARYLWELLQASDREREVLLIYGLEFSSLGSLLLRHAWLALLTGALLLAAWIRRRGIRFGPLLPPPPQGTRALIEHVDALGHFLWRAHHADTLVAGARRALEQQIVRRRPELAVLDAERRLGELARCSQLDRETVRAAVLGFAPRRQADFTRMIRTLEHLRRAL